MNIPGWQLVPLSMTPEMRELMLRDDDLTVDEMWIMLLAASPAPPAQDWFPMDSAPRNERILIKAESGERYAAHWVKHPVTDHEAWMVCGWGDGEQAMCESPVGWMPLPPETTDKQEG